MRTTAQEVARSLEPQTLDLYSGSYEFSDLGGLTLNVTRTDNGLYAAVPGQTPRELLPQTATRFVIPNGYDFYQLDFMVDAARQTCRLALTIYGMSVTGWRK
jgi:hypothetical protein